MIKAHQFITEVFDLLRQVTWPEKEDLVKLTGVVILVSALIAVFLGGVDLGLTKLVGLITVGR